MKSLSPAIKPLAPRTLAIVRLAAFFDEEGVSRQQLTEIFGLSGTLATSPIRYLEDLKLVTTRYKYVPQIKGKGRNRHIVLYITEKGKGFVAENGGPLNPTEYTPISKEALPKKAKIARSVEEEDLEEEKQKKTEIIVINGSTKVFNKLHLNDVMKKRESPEELAVRVATIPKSVFDLAVTVNLKR